MHDGIVPCNSLGLEGFAVVKDMGLCLRDFVAESAEGVLDSAGRVGAFGFGSSDLCGE